MLPCSTDLLSNIGVTEHLLWYLGNWHQSCPHVVPQALYFLNPLPSLAFLDLVLVVSCGWCLPCESQIPFLWSKHWSVISAKLLFRALYFNLSSACCCIKWLESLSNAHTPSLHTDRGYGNFGLMELIYVILAFKFNLVRTFTRDVGESSVHIRTVLTSAFSGLGWMIFTFYLCVYVAVTEVIRNPEIQ